MANLKLEGKCTRKYVARCCYCQNDCDIIIIADGKVDIDICVDCARKLLYAISDALRQDSELY